MLAPGAITCTTIHGLENAHEYVKVKYRITVMVLMLKANLIHPFEIVHICKAT
jgi:hypothetical protein